MKWPKTGRFWQLYLVITRRGSFQKELARLRDDSVNLEMQNRPWELGYLWKYLY